MKKILTGCLLLSILLFTSCKKSSTSEPGCNGVTDLTVTQQADALKINLVNGGSPLFYELSIQSAPGMNPDNTTGTSVINSAAVSLSIDSLHLFAGQVYVFYARSVCTSSEKSQWIGPKSFTISNFCDRPYQLGFSAYPDGMGFDWQVKSGTNATSFQVQYGAKNFTLGSGTIVNVSSSPFTAAPLVANNNYDFYVRSSCSGSLGWSEWAGPYSYLATANQHLCLAPSNVTVQVERNGLGQPVGANFQWSYNGETSFEYTVVRSFQTVNDGTVNSIGTGGFPTVVGLFQDTDYHFYVRAVCVNGNRTNWFGPTLFNIGH